MIRNKKIFTIIVAVVAILALCFFIRFVVGGPEDDWICVDNQWVKHGAPSAPMPITPCGENPVACTMEAKICPDGSAVGRTGPNCEFAACPLVEFDKPVVLGISGSIIYTDGLNISIKEINDSRCKPGVVCIWQGELSTSFVLLHGAFGEVPGEIRLGTVNNKSVSLNGYTFSLESATEQDVTIIVSKFPAEF